jgi:phenylpropionate dioxygenase-like ring-hydroxylating dioxygenase large terminal subunit
MGEKLVFWRDSAGRISCLRDRCAHRGVELSKGTVINDHLQCPFHGFEYDASGRIVLIPAIGRNAAVPPGFKVHSYLTHEAHGFVWIWWGEKPPENLPPPRFFDDIDDDFSCAVSHDPWHAHYSRVIENQLDVIHLPFVHWNTIGRGGRTLVDGPKLEWIDEDMFWVYGLNRVDDGTPPLKPDEVTLPPGREYKLEFIFPNLWQNYISRDMRVVAAFVPVDKEHTILTLHVYQRFVRAPVLRDIVNRLINVFNVYVAHQDRRLVETHEPKASQLRMGEKLIQGDSPIIAYRRRRQELIDAARS